MASAFLSTVFQMSIGPAHLLLYSALLGTELYQSFVVTKVGFRALPRPAYVTLQKKLFPIYFTGQSVLLLLTAATFPSLGPVSLIQHKGDWVPFAVAGATAALNFLLYGPKTRQAMIDRAHHGSQGMKHSDPAMAGFNRLFSKNHAMAIHLNLISIGATLWYGARLASHLQF